MPQTKLPPSVPEEQNRRLWRGFGKFFERVAPTLFEVGVWIFGSLIAFNLLVLASLFTIGPVDPAIKIATVAFALALPLNLTGLIMLRLVKELKGADLEKQLVQAFEEEGFVSDQIPAPLDVNATLEATYKRRMVIVLWATSVIVILSFVLTLVGTMATLWHMAWWISVSFFVMVVICLISIFLVMASSQPPESRTPTQPGRQDHVDTVKR